jgi:hypothetical protein
MLTLKNVKRALQIVATIVTVALVVIEKLEKA